MPDTTDSQDNLLMINFYGNIMKMTKEEYVSLMHDYAELMD